MRKRLSARPYLDKIYPPSEPATPSSYIHHLDDLNATEVILFCRVSENEQSRKGNLVNQVNGNRRNLKERGVTVIERYKCIESGWDNDHWMDRGVLAAAVAHAKRLGVVLVAESLSRLIRSASYHPSKNPSAIPNKAEFEKLMRITDGATLATIVHPDLSPTEERGVQSRRGMVEKHRMGGRPMRKKRRRELRNPEAIRSRLEGNSIAGIARLLDVPESTVRDWLRDVPN